MSKKNDKINIVEDLSSDSLMGIISSLVEKLGYDKISLKQNHIVASITTPLGSELHAFINFNEKLISDSAGIKRVSDSIREISELEKTRTVYIVSNHYVPKAFQDTINGVVDYLNLGFIDRDKIIALVDSHQAEYWKHDDIALLDYEKDFCLGVTNDSELKKLKIFNDKYNKLLNIFIEPSIYHIYEDKETKTPMRSKISFSQLVNSTKPIILAGNAGTGKTTLLKKIGEKIIENNTNATKKKLPVFLSVVEIFESNYDIDNLLEGKLLARFPNMRDVYDSYDVVILIDTIDELEDANQKKIIEKLSELHEKENVNYVISTRSMERILSHKVTSVPNTYTIEKFNNEQIRLFISKFFNHEESRAEDLINALRENRILEKLPITPLSLSLISILYEENNLEIPATVTDIYDNFNSLLLGKPVVSSRIEFIDISFRERILSLYALELLSRKEHTPLTKEEFHKFFKDYFEHKTIPVKKGSLEDILDYLINNTGILSIKNLKYVQFSHDSFMEYYGALEIFKHQRSNEDLFIDGFYDVNWQNAAVFYAGKSKDMPQFLEKVIKKLEESNNYMHFLMGVVGMGYLLQALYQTDNKLRKKGVDTALDLNLRAHEVFMKLAADDSILFKNFNLPILWLMNVLYFYENFNSVTLKTPLKLSFRELIDAYKENPKQASLGYKSLKLAFTLNSKRIGEQNELEEVIMDTQLVHDPTLALLADFSLEVFKGNNYKELKKEVRKSFPKMKDVIKKLLETPAKRLRFTNFDQIRPVKKVKLIAEGKHDVEIIEHAYIVLNNGGAPYWEIRPSGNESGGANEVSKTLSSAQPLLDDDEICIGLYDRDAKGMQEFKGLKANLFDTIKNNTIKKHKNKNIYAICIPVSEDRKQYLISDQNLNYFELEHYLDDEVLEHEDALRKTPIPDVYTIADSKKKNLSTYVRGLTDPKYFVRFIELFRIIDEVTGVETDYIGS